MCESCSVVSDSLWPHRLYSPWDSPGQNTGVGGLSLLQGIFPTQGSNPGLPTLQVDSLPAEPPGKPKITGVGSLSLPGESYQPRNRTGVCCIAGRFFTSWATSEGQRKLWLSKKKKMLWECDKWRVRNEHVHTHIYRIDDQKVCAELHREVYWAWCNYLCEKNNPKKNKPLCITESNSGIP